MSSDTTYTDLCSMSILLILLSLAGDIGQVELSDEVQVLAHQGERTPGGGGDVLLAHAGTVTEMHTPQALNIVLDLLGAVKGLFSYLAGRFLFDQALVANDALVRNRAA